MEFKICLEHDIKMNKDGNGGFEGYGSVFGNFDRVNEAVIKGAFTNLEDFVSSGFIAVGHDWNALPVATIVEAKQDDIGLWIKADFHSTKDAQDARTVIQERIARGKSVGLSIGYEVIESEYVQEGRLLTKLSLFEVSIVTIPANPLAGINSSKDFSLDKLSLDDHTSLMLATAKDYVNRLTDLNSCRQKDGRNLSEVRRNQLAEIKQVFEDALIATTPLANSDDVAKAYANYLFLTSTVNIGETN